MDCAWAIQRHRRSIRAYELVRVLVVFRNFLCSVADFSIEEVPVRNHNGNHSTIH